MPLSGGTSGAHDDSMHQGNAKRDIAEGLAGLDASGFVLAKGAGIAFPRSGSDDVHIYERTSGEEAYAFHRVGADDYTFFIKESNVWKRFQTESMKDVANGIAALDAGGNLLVLGDRIELTRDGTDVIRIRDRTSDETILRALRVGVNDYALTLTSGGGYRVVQTDVMKDVANGIAGLDANACIIGSLLGVASLEGHPITKSASANLRNSHDPQRVSTVTVWTKMKSIVLDKGLAGVIRIDHENFNNQAGQHTFSRVYKNGVALGAIQDNSAAVTWAPYSEDLDIGVMLPGDTLELWSYFDTGLGTNHMVRNFRLSYDNNFVVAVDTTNTTP